MNKRILLFTLLFVGFNAQAVIGEGGVTGGSDAYAMEDIHNVTTPSKLRPANRMGSHNEMREVVINKIHKFFTDNGFEVTCNAGERVKGAKVAEIINLASEQPGIAFGKGVKMCKVSYTGNNKEAAFKTVKEYFNSKISQENGIGLHYTKGTYARLPKNTEVIGWFYSYNPMTKNNEMVKIYLKGSTVPTDLEPVE